MPVPSALGRLNKVAFNRLTRPVLRYLPGFGVVHHRGRRSGLSYRTPVNLFPVEGGFVIALFYGPKTDWVRNVVAAGGCVIETRGRRVHCEAPRLYQDTGRRHIRPVERVALRLLNVDQFLELRESGTG
jgi:deazaflavin-dependent oxidoreductase (nitroreductase family)